MAGLDIVADVACGKKIAPCEGNVLDEEAKFPVISEAMF